MAELTKEVVDQSLTRIEQHSLGDDDVALQTSATLPSNVKVKGTVLDTAGNEQHEPTVQYTSKQVRQIAEQWGSRGRRSGRRAASTDRRTTRGRRAAGSRTPAAGTTAAPESDRSSDAKADQQADDEE